ncbi:MAG: 3-hexulose-6-phosphate synthase [Rubripirellula sp.]
MISILPTKDDTKMTKPMIQMALDSLDFNATLALAEQVAPYVDVFEVGTPCIKYNGLKIVQALSERFPDHQILVDLKTMDAGEYEATPFYAAGADICTVLGVSGTATIAGVVKAAKIHNAKVQVDLINVADKAECAQQSAAVGAHIIGVHTGLDAQAAGETPFGDLTAIANLGLDVKISVAGGIKPATLAQVVQSGANIVVVGAAIYGADSPAEAAKEIRETLDNALAANA